MAALKVKTLPDFEIESGFWKQDKIVAGVDEAGRGALAGPVVAAAVILPQGVVVDPGINDSKKLSPEKREELFEKVVQNAISYGIGIIDNERIDKINILKATIEAMHQAIGQLSMAPHHLLIDGNYFRHPDIPYTTVIRGDSISISIAAASILAKVTRDRWMKETACKEFSNYGFDIHKGYGTRKHYENINKHGICSLHRKTFLKKYFLKEDTLFG